MRRSILPAMIVVVLFVTVSVAAVASDHPPHGTYEQTCRNIRVNGNLLSAECQTNDGHWHVSRLENFTNCSGDITNNNGQLDCKFQDGHSVPQGPYVQTCRDIRVNANILFARCQAKNGNWRDTSLRDFSQCSGNIVNDNGELECTTQTSHAMPKGPYAQSCRDIRVNGDQISARCETKDGQWHATSLDFKACPSNVVNDNGQLRCGSGQ